MKFISEIEIDNEHLNVLLDYHKGYELNDEYFNLTDKQEVEREMCYDVGLLEGGFYQQYPLEPTGLGRFILSQYLKKSVIMPINNVDLKPLDINKIIQDNTTYDIINIVDCEQDINIHGVVNQAIKEALPEILKYCSGFLQNATFTEEHQIEILEKLGI